MEIVGQRICVNGFHFLRNKLRAAASSSSFWLAVWMIGWDFESLGNGMDLDLDYRRGLKGCSMSRLSARWPAVLVELP